jgi:rhodanese-related sulfurtransferase
MKPALLLLSLALTAPFTSCVRAQPSTTAPAPKSPPAASRNVTVDEAQALLKADKKIIVLDVRTPEEFATAHIPGAKNINFNAPDFKAAVGALDRKATYLVHCQSGGRSARATAAMKELQFKSVLHLNEGFSEWEAAGKPVEK